MSAFSYKGLDRTWNPKYLSKINHVVLVVDASGSMRSRSRALIELVQKEIRKLAFMSESTEMETRVSVYVFNGVVECVIYDMDVLRQPSLEDIYVTSGTTALLDATGIAIEELEKTATLHGDHSFLFYVISDGEENDSKLYTTDSLNLKLSSLSANWTLGCFVPDDHSRRRAVAAGFPAGNVVIWNAAPGPDGLEQVGLKISQATETFFAGRAIGQRGFQGGSLFGTGTENLNSQTVAAAGLKPVDKKRYLLLPVREKIQTQPFAVANGLQYRNGSIYYQFMKTEHIQPGKKVLLLKRATNEVFESNGKEARRILGLPDDVTIKGKPTINPDWDVYIQSTAPNRNLIPNTTAIILDPAKVSR